MFQEAATTKIPRLNGSRMALLSAGDARTVMGTAYTRQVACNCRRLCGKTERVCVGCRKYFVPQPLNGRRLLAAHEGCCRMFTWTVWLDGAGPDDSLHAVCSCCWANLAIIRTPPIF